MPSDSQDDRVSVVIPHYGDPVLASQVVKDLRGQQTRRSLEIIVVDDCSPQSFPATPGVRVVRRPDNGGFGAAINSGAAIASGDWLVMANSDVRMGSHFIDRLLEAAMPLMPAVVGPASRRSDGTVEPTGRRFPSATEMFLSTAYPLQRYADRAWFLRLTGRVLSDSSTPRPVDWVQGSLILLPLDVFRRVGGFDERYFMYSEEVDLQRRLHDLGVQRWLLPEVEVTHLGGASTGGTNVGERMTLSRFVYAEKWGGRVALRRALTATAILNLVCRTAVRALGRPSAPRHAWRREWAQARQRTYVST